MRTQKAALFVDVTNQFYASDRLGARIDYAKYLERAALDFTITRALAYGAQMGREAEPFLAVLRTLGYEPRYRTAVLVGDRPDIRRTDRNVALAMDLWRLSAHIDVAIIGSNDPDLVPLLVRIREQGILAVVYATGVGRELRDLANRVIEVEASILVKREELPLKREASEDPEITQPVVMPAHGVRDGVEGPGGHAHLEARA